MAGGLSVFFWSPETIMYFILTTAERQETDIFFFVTFVKVLFGLLYRLLFDRSTGIVVSRTRITVSCAGVVVSRIRIIVLSLWGVDFVTRIVVSRTRIVVLSIWGVVFVTRIVVSRTRIAVLSIWGVVFVTRIVVSRIRIVVLSTEGVVFVISYFRCFVFIVLRHQYCCFARQNCCFLSQNGDDHGLNV